MIGRAVDIPTPHGTMDGYAAHPDGGGRFALVVLFMDVWGLREELFAIARRVAAHGYYCVVPNLFYREGKIRYERRNASGKMVSFDTLPVALQEEMRGNGMRSTGRRRAPMSRRSSTSAAASRSTTVRPDRSASAWAAGLRCIAAQEFPQRFRANASLHGTLAGHRGAGFAASAWRI